MNVLTAGGAGSISKSRSDKDSDGNHSECGFPNGPSTQVENQIPIGCSSPTPSNNDDLSLSEGEEEQSLLCHDEEKNLYEDSYKNHQYSSPSSNSSNNEIKPDGLYSHGDPSSTDEERAPHILWLAFCFFGIMSSFVLYGYLLEFATTGGRKLHELSFLFVTSLLYTITGAVGRYVTQETPTAIPPSRFAILGMTSMGSTFCSVRSLRFVIFPIQVLAKSCKPVPVMIMGALMGKKYPLRKYINVCLIVSGVALFMGGGDTSKKDSSNTENSFSSVIGIVLLFISLCFDGGTGAYEDKLMSVHSVGPFDLMYNIQLGKTIIAFVGLLVLNQMHSFRQMCYDMGFVLLALGFTGALGQIFIFVTISKFGALTCSIIGLARKVTTLVVSIYIYSHPVNVIQKTGLFLSVGAMIMNFWGKKGSGNHGGHGDGHNGVRKENLQKQLDNQYRDSVTHFSTGNNLQLKRVKAITAGTG